jgi:hypothetical protein
MQPDSTQATNSASRHGALGAATLALFLAWRRMLTRAWRRCERAARTASGIVSAWASQWGLVRAYHSDTVSAWGEGRAKTRSVAAAFGARAFIGGLAIASGVALAGGDPLEGVLLTMLLESLWAVARLTILTLLVPRDELERGSLLVVYAAALMPYALALGPVLRLGALAVSGMLTARGLLAAGVSTPTVRRAAGWAFGGQAAVLLIGTAGRALLALITAV